MSYWALVSLVYGMYGYRMVSKGGLMRVGRKGMEEEGDGREGEDRKGKRAGQGGVRRDYD